MVKSSIQNFSEVLLGTRQEVFGFLAKKGRIVKTVFLLSTGGFYGKQLSAKFFLVFGYVRSSCDDLLFYRGKKSLESVKAAFNVSAEKVRGEPFTFGKVTTIFFVGLLSIVFPWGFQNCMLRVQRKILRVLNGTLSALSSDLSEKISNFCL